MARDPRNKAPQDEARPEHDPLDESKPKTPGLIGREGKWSEFITDPITHNKVELEGGDDVIPEHAELPSAMEHLERSPHPEDRGRPG